MLDRNGLLPCPFCGSVAALQEADGENLGAWFIECSNKQCAMTSNLQWSEKGNEGIEWLKERWNCRVQAPKPLTGGIVERIAYAHTVPTNGHNIEYRFDWDAIALELTKPLGEELK